jgi:hypothetical protein
MLLRLDPKHYGEELAAIILKCGDVKFVYMLDEGDGGYVQNVNQSQLEEVKLLIELMYPEIPRRGSPNHDCTGQWIRWRAQVIVSEPDYEGLMQVTVKPGISFQDI